MVQWSPAGGSHDIDVRHVERNSDRQETLVPIPHLKVRTHRPSTKIDQLRHVIVGIELPRAALEVEIVVEAKRAILADVRVKLVGVVVAGTHDHAVVVYGIKEGVVGQAAAWVGVDEVGADVSGAVDGLGQ